MSEAVNKGLTIGNPNDPLRIIGRLKRLKESLLRAEGERKVSMETEIAQLEAKVAEIRAALTEDAPAEASPSA